VLLLVLLQGPLAVWLWLLLPAGQLAALAAGYRPWAWLPLLAAVRLAAALQQQLL
jgi:hypothetical protein